MFALVCRYSLLLSLLSLSACSSLNWFSNKSSTPKATPLANIEQKITVKKIAQHRISRSATPDAHRLPQITADRIFTVYPNGAVFARDRDTGNKIWETELRNKIRTGPSFGDGIVVVGDTRDQLIALSAKDGKILWRKALSGELLAEAVIAKHKVIAKTLDGKVTAFNSKNGQQLWQYQHQNPALVLRASSRPTVAADRVIVGFADGKLAALSLAKGELLWQRALSPSTAGLGASSMKDIDSNPIVKDNVIYTASYQGNIAAVSLYSGNIIWQHDFSTYLNLAVNSQAVFAIDTDGQIWAFDRSNGMVLWQQADFRYRKLSAPTLLDQTLVIADNAGYLHWLSSKNGSIVARSYFNYLAKPAQPVAVDHKIYVFSDNGLLTEYQIG